MISASATRSFRRENIRGGVAYLAGLLSRFNQDVSHALAAYNAGAARVERYKGVPPYRETQNYVRRITAATKTAKRAPRPIPVIYKWIELVNGQPNQRATRTSRHAACPTKPSALGDMMGRFEPV